MPEPNDSKVPTRTISAVIHGRVQGVGYRHWTREQAERLGLSGYVRNRVDGAVEAVLSGATEAVAAWMESCRQGPPGARIDEVAFAELDDAPPEGPFRIRQG